MCLKLFAYKFPHAFLTMDTDRRWHRPVYFCRYCLASFETQNSECINGINGGPFVNQCLPTEGLVCSCIGLNVQRNSVSFVHNRRPRECFRLLYPPDNPESFVKQILGITGEATDHEMMTHDCSPIHLRLLGTK